MFKKVTKLLGVIALTGWMGVANATLIFDFSWDSSNGKISGEILGLTNVVGSQGATGVVITSINGVDVSIDVINDARWLLGTNIFHVFDSEVVYSDFYSFTRNGEEDIYWKLESKVGGWVNTWNATYTRDYYNQIFASNINPSFPSVSFVNRVTVPEPDSVILVLLGLAGLSFARYRRQS